MKNFMFIWNGTKPDKEMLESKEPICLNNFCLPPVVSANKLGYTILVGENRLHAASIECLNADTEFFFAGVYRNILAVGDNYAAYKKIMQKLEEKEFDVIHCNTPIGGVLGRLCGRKAGVRRIIYTAHGFHFYKGAPFFARLIFKSAEKLMARWTDAIITMNEEDYQAARKFSLRDGGSVYKVHGVGIDTSLFGGVKRNRSCFRELGLPDNAFVIITVGDLVKNKNHKVQIEAIKFCDDPNVHLLICGEGPEKKHLEEYSGQIGVSENVHFLGFRRDIVGLLSASDAFVLSSRREGLPRSLMEAMASGLPCVVSNVRGNVDLIVDEKNGFVCDVSHSFEFADAIRRLYGDEQLRKVMGALNRKKSKEYDVSKVIDELDYIYGEVLNK